MITITNENWPLTEKLIIEGNDVILVSRNGESKVEKSFTVEDGIHYAIQKGARAVEKEY